MSREPFDAADVPAIPEAQNVSGNEFPVTLVTPPMRGKRKHADDASRVAAFRAKRARLDVTTTPRIGDTIASLAQQFDCSQNEVVNSLLRFALTNRNWRTLGLYGEKHQAAQQEGAAQ